MVSNRLSKNGSSATSVRNVFFNFILVHKQSLKDFQEKSL